MTNILGGIMIMFGSIRLGIISNNYDLPSSDIIVVMTLLVIGTMFAMNKIKGGK